MITERKAANAIAGKTARACDGCLRKRARWFCAADDAFLCQACDSSVHSANQLARRHERVRLETASSKVIDVINMDDAAPAWHQGFTRKARTPRSNNKSIFVQQQIKGFEDKILISNNHNHLPLVPEIGSEEEGNMVGDDKDDQLLCRVPVFDPFDAELCEILTRDGREVAMGEQDGNLIAVDGCNNGQDEDLDNLPGFLSSDMGLAQFAADVENLLGGGFDKDSPDIKDLGLLDCKDEDDNDEKFGFNEQVVKIKDEQDMENIADCHFGQDFDMSTVSLMDWNFDYESPMTADEEEEEKIRAADAAKESNRNKKDLKRNISLRLNYDSVITAWASQGSPWTTGSRPELDPDDYWPNCMGACTKDVRRQYGGMTGHGGGGGDGGREARVMRYKEKRRTRLFSKKIRYEVRKLNAEKRPRMKGRFVKRTSFMGTAFPYNLNTNSR